MSTGESIKLVMLAFALGLGVPLVLQAFVTLRAVHKVVTSTQARLDRALKGLEGLEGLVARVPGATAASPPATQALSVLGAALVPAALTAFKVWKEASAGAGVAAAGAADAEASTADGTADVPPPASPSSSSATSERENGHART
jgi:hypothetical protein